MTIPMNLLEEGGDYYSHRGLEIVSGLSSEMDNVKKVAASDVEALSASVSNLRHESTKAKEVLNEIATLEERWILPLVGTIRRKCRK
jgi:hypothetical protein